MYCNIRPGVGNYQLPGRGRGLRHLLKRVRIPLKTAIFAVKRKERKLDKRGQGWPIKTLYLNYLLSTKLPVVGTIKFSFVEIYRFVRHSMILVI